MKYFYVFKFLPESIGLINKVYLSFGGFKMENWARSEFNIYMSIRDFFKTKRVYCRYRPIWLKGISGHSLELDIYLPDDGIAIEHNGDIHNNSDVYMCNLLRKRELCKEMGVKLLVIGSSDDCDIQIDNSNYNLYNKLVVEKSIKFIIYNLDITLDEKESLLFKYQSITKKLMNLSDVESCYNSIISSDFTPSVFDKKELKDMAKSGLFINYNDYKLLCVRNMCLLLGDYMCLDDYINISSPLTYKRMFDIEIHGEVFRCYKV